jgi:RHS repeat-associated protein
MPRRYLKTLIILGFASVVSAQTLQQPAETLPGFKAENVLEARGIDNVNPFSGDPGVVLPIGPEYNLSAAFKWRLTAYYSVKFWNFPDPCSSDPTGTTKFAYVQGDPTLGAGWTLQLGYVVPTPFSQAGGWTYFGPDGGRHAVNLDSHTGIGVAQDGSHLRITAVGFPATTYYTVEFPDGTKEYFDHQFSPPTSTVISQPGVTARYGMDFNNFNLNRETPSKRFGLGHVEDRFGNRVLEVAYASDPGQPAGDPSEPTNIILNPDANHVGPNVSLHWSQTTGSTVQWWVVDSILFPASGSLKRQVSFQYQLNSITRNQYDTSHLLVPPQPCNTDALPASVPDAPLLQTVTFADSNAASPSFPSFQYAFGYALAPGTGELTSITLPTGGTIQYGYGPTSGVVCDFYGTAPCGPEGSSTSASGGGNIGNHPLIGFLDNSLAVGTRTEYDPVSNRTSQTSYDRVMLVPCTSAQCTEFDDSRLYRRVRVTSPGNDLEGPGQFITRSYYKVAPSGPPVYPFSGFEVDRRYYAGSLDSGIPIRTLIRCYGHSAPVCGYRAKDGKTLQQYDSTNVEPPQAEATWYGAVPSGSDGGACSGTTPCTASVNSNYIVIPGTPPIPIGEYGTNQVSSTVPGTPSGWSRTTATGWTPQTTPRWMLDIVTSRQTQETPSASPTSETTSYSVNLTNGFLNSSSVSDSTYGGRQDEFTAPDTRWDATTEIQDILPSSSGMKIGAFTDTRIFQDGTRKMGGLLRSVQRSGVSWKSFDVDRDDNTGLITFSRDPNPSLVTGYMYDALGRLTRITPPTPDVPTSVSYVSPTETLVTRTSSDGNTWQRYLYDGLGRLRREIRRMPGMNGSNFSVRFHDYDKAGHASFLSEWQLCSNGAAGGDCEGKTPLGTTSSNFDPFGRPQKITKADGNYTTIDYSDGTVTASETKKRVTTCINASNAVTQQNPSGACSGIAAVTTDQYDALGRLTTVTEANGNPTTYTYSVLDKLATVAQGSQSRTFAYDATGLLRSETTPEKGNVAYVLYDALGNLTQSREPNGVNLTRVYSAAGRLKTLSSDEAGLPTYLTNTWNDATAGSSFGRLTSRVSKTVMSKGPVNATETMTYSANTGRLVSRQFDFSPGATGLVTSWTYNKLGVLDTMTNLAAGQEKSKVKYTYDSASGFPTGVTGEPAPGITTALASNGFYAAYGGFASFTLANGTGAQITPDPMGLPRPSQIAVGSWNSGTYAYDGSGNVLQTGSSSTYVYDALSRISRATITGQPVQNFAYDQYGNLASKGTQSFTVDTARNRICDPAFFTNSTCTYPAGSIVAYDALGNLTRWGSTTQQYFYDTLSRQTDYNNGSTQESYLYDGAGERVARSGAFPAASNLTILTSTAPALAVCPGSALTVQFQASGGTPFAPPHSPYNWSISGVNPATLPSWLTSDATGVLTASPPTGTASGSYVFQITATDSQDIHASNNFTLNVGSCPPYWIAQPADAIVCPGDLFDQSIRARDANATPGGPDNVTYQWQRLAPDGVTWISLSSVPGYPWEVREQPPAQINYYRAIATSTTNGTSVTSRVATVRVSATIEITSLNPGSTICPGQGQNLGNFITALGGNLTIGWQQQNSDGTWTDLTSSQVSPTQTTVYRAKLTSTCVAQPVYSSSITISAQPNPVLTQAPPSQNVCAGSSVILTATANTQGYFTWQHWNGSSWVQDRATVNLASSDTYTTTPTATTSCRVTFSAYCGVVSSNFTLTQVTTPTVTNMPAGGDVCPPIALTHNPTVTGAASMQWQQNLNGGAWTNISGATSASYTSPSLTTPGTYGYRIAATNSCGTNYGTTYWTVNAIPSASITGSACSVPAGQPSTLTCATDTPSPRFLWSPGGQTTQSITVTPTTTTTYTCTVTSIKNCTRAASYTVTVGSQVNAPVITTNPVSQTICSGSSGATLSGAASGTNVLYQWQKQNADSSWSNVSGATLAIYTAPGSSATYRLAASNACGTVYSSPATVTVDTTKQVAAITAQPQSTEYCAGSAATLSVTATGTSLSYLWESSADRSFWTVVGNAATVSVSPASTTYYRVTVSNTCNSVVSNVVTVTRATPVTITTQPIGGTFCPPSHQLYVIASGGTLTYQWQVLNGSWTNISGATTNAYSATATGQYRVVVTDVCGSVTSNSVLITFGTAPGQPTIAGDTFIYPGQSAHIYVSNQRFDWNAAFWTDGGSGFDRHVSPAVTTTYQVYVTGASYPCPSPWSPPFTVTVSGTSSALYGGYQSGSTPGSQAPAQTASATPAGTIILAQASPDMHSNKFLSVVRAHSDRIVAGDWNGDGVSSLGFYDVKKGQFELWDGDPKGGADYKFVFGPAGSWQPITGDWDGDGIDTVGLFDPTTGQVWLKNANSDGAPDLTYTLQLPFQNGIAVTGDWTGKGFDTLGVYDPSESVFYLFDSHKSGKPDHAVRFGQPGSGALPLAGDWDAQGLTAIGLYDPASGNVYLRQTLTNGPPELAQNFAAGLDQVFAGRWDAQKHAPGTRVKKASRSPIEPPSGPDSTPASPEQVSASSWPPHGWLQTTRWGGGDDSDSDLEVFTEAAASGPAARAATSTWFYTIRDESNRPSIEYHVDQGGNVITDRIYAYLGNTLVATYEADNNPPGWVYYGTDHLGSIRYVMSGSNCTQTFQPFGELASTGCGEGGTLKFAGMERDATSGNDYDHARFHGGGSTLARFLSPDKIGGRVGEPQSWNRYAYAGNSPLTYVDPNGKLKFTAQTVSNALNNLADKIDAINATMHDQAIIYGVSGGLRAAAGALSLGSPTGELIETGTQREIMDSVINESIAAGAMAEGMWSLASPMLGAEAEIGSVGMPEIQVETSTLQPGPYATESIPARGPGRSWNTAERAFATEEGRCHTCGVTSPGTKSGSWVLDHQPPNALAGGSSQRLYRHCATCSFPRQANEVRTAKRRGLPPDAK